MLTSSRLLYSTSSIEPTILPSSLADPLPTPATPLPKSPLTGAELPSYLTWALPNEEGKYYKSEMSKMVTGKLQRNKPFEVTVLWKKQPKTLACILKTRVKHQLYGKYYDHIRKIQVHDPYDECQAGDVIMIKQSRPYSKLKHHVVDSILRKEIGHAHLDENPEDVTTNELRRVLDERKRAMRHGVVYMSDVQQLYLERELLRLQDSIEKAREGAENAAQQRKERLLAIRDAKARDRELSLRQRLAPPRRSFEKLGTPSPWSFDPYAISRRIRIK